MNFKDNRGMLFFPVKGGNFKSVENTISVNHKFTFRGIHINKIKKLVTCVSGRVLDIIIDFNPESENYLVVKYFILDPNTDLYQLEIPENFGHAFLSLEHNSILIYNFSCEFKEEETIHINYKDKTLRISEEIFKFISENRIIISEKDSRENYLNIDYFLIGKNGFIGSNILNYMKKEKMSYYVCNERFENMDKIKQEITNLKPKYVINCAGLTGNPNIFWCDENKEETLRINLIKQICLVNICSELKIKIVTCGTGAIFNDDKVYSELDRGNFYGNFYSESRIYLENICKNFKNCLYLRINCPISVNDNPKNLLTKIKKFTKVSDKKMSITNLDSLIPVLFLMLKDEKTGICNFVNPGFISVKQIKELFDKDYIVDNMIDVNKSIPKLECGMLKEYEVEDINAILKILI